MADEIHADGRTRTRSTRARNRDGEGSASTGAANKREEEEKMSTEGTEAEAKTTKEPIRRKPQDTGNGRRNASGGEETKRYANHVPGELERVLEEFMDAYEITEELMGQGEKPKANINQKGQTNGSRGEKKKNNEEERTPRSNIRMQPQQNKRKCRQTTKEMGPSQENQTTKEAIRTRKEEKEEPTQEDSGNNEEKEPRETHQEDHEPDTLERLIEEWADAEDEQWGKQQALEKIKNKTHHKEQ